jgi:glycosyltransferase involved in cell wall biosynthesis
LTSVLILNHEPLVDRMPGPTIRNWELARVLSSDFDVTLAAPGQSNVQSADFRTIAWGDTLPRELIAQHDVVKVSGFLLYQHGVIESARHLVVDLYDPFPLENLHMYEDRAIGERHRIAMHDRDVQSGLLRAGDVFLSASDRQRDFWLGWLAAEGRVNPYTHATDPGMERFVLVVPFGVPDEPPQPAPARFRGVVPGIGAHDLVVVWGGGIWNWFDPLTLIRAAALTADRLPSLRVLFPATSVPSPDVLPMRMLSEARTLAEQLGVTGSRVFFGSGWIPYSEHGGVLLESDIGVSLHQPSVETRFSFRTRILDYLWAGLPIIATEGDSMADLIQKEDLGRVVRPGDVDAVIVALLELGSDAKRRRECGARSTQAAARFRWSELARPLIDYCSRPYSAPDRELHRTAARRPSAPKRPNEVGRVLSRTIEVLQKEGPKNLARKGSDYVLKRSKRRQRSS